jgi:hypothetical protein
MGVEVDRPGLFRGEIVDYGMTKRESGAVCIRILARLDQYWCVPDGGEIEEWLDWPSGGMEANGDVYIIKKDGTLNQGVIKSLMAATGWGGSVVDINSHEWRPNPCQFVIKADEYQGKVRHRIEFLNEYDRTPGGQMSSLDETDAKALELKFGGQIRALKGNAGRNEAKPKGKPPAPPKADKVLTGLPKQGNDDVPFGD